MVLRERLCLGNEASRRAFIPQGLHLVNFTVPAPITIKYLNKFCQLLQSKALKLVDVISVAWFELCLMDAIRRVVQFCIRPCNQVVALGLTF